MTILETLFFSIVALSPGISLVVKFGQSKSDFLLALPLTCGLVYVLGNYSSIVGLPVNSWWYLAVLVALFALLRFRGERQPRNIRKLDQVDKIAAIFCAVAGFVLVAWWFRSARFFGQLLPNHDAMYHSYVIRNIVETQSLRIDEALRLFPLGSGSAADFYPLGLHSLIALATQITDVSISGAMNVVTVLFGIAVFPINMWLWTREFAKSSRITALVTPIAVVMVSSVFPFSPLSWGGMPAIVGMCVAPSVAVFAFRVLISPSTSGVFLLTLSLIGVFSLHTTEVVLVGLLTLILILSQGQVSLSQLLNVVWKILIGAAIALAPVMAATLGGASERQLDYQPVIDIALTLGQSVLFSFSGFVLSSAAVLVLIGLIYARGESTSALPWSLFLLLGVICLAAGFPQNSIVRLVTKPWYGQVLRLNYNVVYLAVPLIVIGVSSLLLIRKHILIRVCALGAVLFLVCSGLTQAHRANHQLLESWYNGLVPPNKNSIAAYDWMAVRLEQDEYVMTDFDGVDGSTWMYAISGAKPVMYGAITSDERDRWRQQKISVLKNMGNLSNHPDLLAFLSSSRVKYFYFDERTNAISPNHTVSLEQLQSERTLTKVYTNGNAHIFEVKT